MHLALSWASVDKRKGIVIGVCSIHSFILSFIQRTQSCLSVVGHAWLTCVHLLCLQALHHPWVQGKTGKSADS